MYFFVTKQFICSERELVDEENLYDSVPSEEKEGIYGAVVGFKKPLSLTKATVRALCLFHFSYFSFST